MRIRKRGPEKDFLVLLVVTDHVAGVLAQEALDALAELLRALHVDLLHPVLARLQVGRRGERGDLARLLVVERDVRDQVLDHRERPHRGDRDGLALLERVHPAHAHQLRHAVDLGAAGAALAGLAVPADREVRGLGRLQPVDDVEDDLALVDLDLVVVEVTALAIAPPHAELGHVTHAGSSSSVRYFFNSSRSNSSSRSSRIGIWSFLTTVTPSPSLCSEQTSSSLRHSEFMPGKSSRV